MSRHLVEWLLKNPIDLPPVENVGADRAWRVLMGLADHAHEDTGRVWVSDRTQEKETGLERRGIIQPVRQALEQAGWLVDTGKRGAKGVKVFELVVPGYARPVASGEGDLATKSVDKRASGEASGEASGVGSGEGDLAQTELNRTTPLPPTNEPKRERDKTPRGGGKEWGERHEQVLAGCLAREDMSRDKGGLRAHLAKLYRPIVTEVLRDYPGRNNETLVGMCVAKRKGEPETHASTTHAPRPDCQECKGRGVIHQDAVLTDQGWEAQPPVPCPVCAPQDTQEPTRERVSAERGTNTDTPTPGATAEPRSDLVGDLTRRLKRVV